MQVGARLVLMYVCIDWLMACLSCSLRTRPVIVYHIRWLGGCSCLANGLATTQWSGRAASVCIGYIRPDQFSVVFAFFWSW